MADFPDIEPDLEEIGLIANNQVYDSILTGQVQTASLSGAKWACAPTFSNRNGKEARDLRAFIFGQNGVSGRFNYYPASIDNAGKHAGLGVVDGAGQTGSTLETTDWDANQPLLFAAGDYLTVNGEMKMVTEDVGTTGELYEYKSENNFLNQSEYDAWSGIGQTGTVSSGLLTIESTTTDPQMIKSFNFDGNIFSQIKIRSKLTGGSNSTNKLFYRTELSPSFDVIKSFDFSQSGVNSNGVTREGPDGDGFFTFTIDASTQQDWLDSNVIGIRIDFTNAEIGTQTEVDYIYIRTPNPTANATIPITPPLRTSPPDGALIEANNPYFQGRLESDDMSRLQVSSPVIYNTTLSIVEAF